MSGVGKRDWQKPEVYAAEWLVRDVLKRGGNVEILGSTLTLPPETRFGDIEAIRTYVAGIEASDWYRATWPGTVPLEVTERRGRSRAEKQSQAHAHYHCGAIHIPATTWSRGDWAMRELVVLHEMAHHLTIADYHGPAFAGAFIHLVTNAIGPEAGFLLADAMRGNNVEINYIAA